MSKFQSFLLTALFWLLYAIATPFIILLHIANDLWNLVSFPFTKMRE